MSVANAACRRRRPRVCSLADACAAPLAAASCAVSGCRAALRRGCDLHPRGSAGFDGCAIWRQRGYGATAARLTQIRRLGVRISLPSLAISEVRCPFCFLCCFRCCGAVPSWVALCRVQRCPGAAPPVARLQLQCVRSRQQAAPALQAVCIRQIPRPGS